MNNFLKPLATLGLSWMSLSLAFSPAQSASLSLDQNFRTPSFARANPATHTVLLPDGKFLLFSGTDTLTDQRTGALTRHFADGSLDSSFHFTREYKMVTAVAPLADGQLIVVATRGAYDVGSIGDGLGSTASWVLRVNPDGSIDSTFNSAAGNSAPLALIAEVVVQPDGKILLAGWFTSFAGLNGQAIARLLANGMVDPSFTSPLLDGPAYGAYIKPVLQPDGKILVGGNFTQVNGVARPGVARLNSNGSLDSSFQPSGFTQNSVRALALEADGKIVLGGRFRASQFPFITWAPLFRLNADGSPDASYTLAPGNINSTFTRDFLFQPDGKIVAANATTVQRFNANGSRDSSFSEPLLIDGRTPPGSLGTAYTVGLQADGRILVAGIFTRVGSGTPDGLQFGVARLNANGTVDPTFVTSHKTGYETPPTSFVRLPDASTLVAFSADSAPINPALAFNFARLLPTGAPDPNFALSPLKTGSALTATFLAANVVRLADGELFVFGKNQSFPQTAGKFRADGNEDPGFSWSEGRPHFANATALRDDGMLLSPGSDPQATVDAGLIRIRPNGKMDENFQLPALISGSQVIRDGNGAIQTLNVGTRVLAVGPDGRILFIYLSYDQAFRLVRLNPDGSIDGSFAAIELPAFDLAFSFPVVSDPWFGLTQVQTWSATPPVLDAHILPDGRILLAGKFTTFNGAPARGLVRLHSNGSVDETFTVGGGVQWTQTVETSSFFPGVEAIEEQVDGKLLIAGTFEAFNGTTFPGVASLNPDGSVDPSFIPPAKRLKFVSGEANLARQPDGSFFLGGPYAFPNESEPSLIRIVTTGGIPVVGSPTITRALVGQTFSYQVVASGQPTSYAATGLPVGFDVNTTTGLVTGMATAANIGTYSVMLTATNVEGTSAPRELVLTIPQPLQVLSAASRQTHGAAGIFDIDLPFNGPAGVECRSGAISGVSEGRHFFVFTFTNPMANARVNVPGASSAFADVADNEIIVYADGLTDVQTTTVTVSGLADSFSQTLPDVSVSVNLLLGDTNGNKTVNATDIGQIKSQSGAAVTAANFRTDVNASGTITASDIGQVKASAGHTLP